MNENRSNNEIMEASREVDYLKEAGRAFDYLENHPGVGMIAGGTLTAGGITALVYYGSKLLSA